MVADGSHNSDSGAPGDAGFTSSEVTVRLASPEHGDAEQSGDDVPIPISGQQVTFGSPEANSIGNAKEAVEQSRKALRWPLVRWAQVYQRLVANPTEASAIWSECGVSNATAQDYVQEAWNRRIDGDTQLQRDFEAHTGHRWSSLNPRDVERQPVGTHEDPAPMSPQRSGHFADRLPGQRALVIPASNHQHATLRSDTAASPNPAPPAAAPVAPAAVPTKSAAARARELTRWPLDDWALLCAQIAYAPDSEQEIWASWEVPERALQMQVIQVDESAARGWRLA